MTRDEIYRAVWAHPLTTVATRLAISPSALRKACRAAQVPVPPRGHWVKASIGTACSPPALPGRKEEKFVFRKRTAGIDQAPPSGMAPKASSLTSTMATPEGVAESEPQMPLRSLQVIVQNLVPENTWLSILERIDLTMAQSSDPQFGLPRTDLRRLIRTLQVRDFIAGSAALMSSQADRDDRQGQGPK